MGASKSKRFNKNRRPSKELNEEARNKFDSSKEIVQKNNENSAETEANTRLTSPLDQSSDGFKKGTKKFVSRKSQKTRKSTATVFSNKSISNLSRSLEPNEWIKLAYALGFIPQGIAHFTGRSSSAQNSYSQATMMLKTWREIVPQEEILPRLCDALKRIRRHDLAVKVGLELAINAVPNDAENKPGSLLDMIKSKSENIPPFKESKELFGDKNVSFLARQILAREEWKRLAYALGFYPDDASHIIASASSSQNLYAQAHLMLMKWRDQISPMDLVPRLREAFIRIRRHDLVFLLDLGIVAGPREVQAQSLVKLQEIFEEVKMSEKTSLGLIEIQKFRDFHK